VTTGQLAEKRPEGPPVAEKAARSAARWQKKRSAAGGRKSGAERSRWQKRREAPPGGRKSGAKRRRWQKGPGEENTAKTGERIFPLWIRLLSCLKTQFSLGAAAPRPPLSYPTQLENIFKKIQTKNRVQKQKIFMESSSILSGNTNFRWGLPPPDPRYLSPPNLKTSLLILVLSCLMKYLLIVQAGMPNDQKQKRENERKEKTQRKTEEETKKDEERAPQKFFCFSCRRTKKNFAGGRKLDFMDSWQESRI